MRRYAVIFFLLSLLPVLRAFPQTPSYQFTRIDIDQGLSNNQVSCIFKDSKGFMWFGTVSGLNRYDGYTFRIFKHDLRDTTSLPDNFIERITGAPGGLLWIYARDGQHVYDPARNAFRQPQPVLQQWGIPGAAVNDIVRDTMGRYWFIVPAAGLYCYTPGKQPALHIQHTKDSASISDNNIAAISGAGQGHCWLLHGNGLLEKMDGRTHRVIYRNDYLQRQHKGAVQTYSLLTDREGDLWIYSTTDPQGVWYFNRATQSFVHYDQNSSPIRLNNNIVRGVVQDNQGRIWIGTDHGGINIINKQRQSIHYEVNQPENPKSLAQNSITTLYKDNTGIIWVGTYKKGVSYYHENIVKFPLYQHQPFNAQSLPYDDVNRFVEDDAGNLWIGTNGGGLIYFNRNTNTYTQYRHDPNNPASLSSDVIVSLWIDHRQQLWVGTYFGGLDCFANGRFAHYRNDPANPASLSNNSVWEIFEDSRQQLWVGTLGAGLNLFNPATQTFRVYRKEQPNAIHSNYIAALLEDQKGNLWIGTDNGVDIKDAATGRFTAYSKTLSNNNVICLFEDSRGWIWIGTREGLNLYDPQQQQSRIFRKEDGLPDNTVLNILEDNDHTLWMSTPNGLSNLSITTAAGKTPAFHFLNYDAADGLQGKEFNENAALKTRQGELLFGGSNGFNLFYPHTITRNKNVPPLVFTDFQVFNKSMGAGEKINGRVLLRQDISATQQITLKYKENVFSIGFAALSYFHPEKSRYAYMLEGFNQEWLTTGDGQRKATFTNLDPGDYVFRVKASNNDGVWTQHPLELRIKILPPFWKTPLAFLIYGVLILGALLLARRLMLERERLRFRIEQERQQAQRMHELDALKIRFFTNISHEFRTPLSLIITPLEKIIKNTQETGVKGQLELIQRNARRLLNLVNQLLDFRKMEVQEIKLHTTEGDIVAFIQELTASFSDLSEKKQVRLNFHTSVGSLVMSYDADKIEKIIFNLLSNAFKFTPEHGHVTVGLQLSDDGRQLIIQVKDTGIGMPLEQQERIFERFFQHEGQGSLLNQGSGIGLSITREFVKLHGGTITVDSAPEMGSCFTIQLPVKTNAALPVPVTEITAAGAHTVQTPSAPAPAPVIPVRTGKKPLVLLVEDNEDFRFYLKDNLGLHYQVATAENGQSAWNILQHSLPDLVVSDISMPVMDGLELCRRIRGNQRTAHIPIILLTARTTEADQLEALERGATDFITKPFSFEVLLSRIRNLIAQQVTLKKSLREKITVNPSEVAISSADEQFIQQALQVVEKHLSDPDFSVEDLSRALHMSRVSAYKKILSLTGKTPIEFIRSIRLKRAAQLLEKSQLTVAEVAYEVGFNNPKYFSRYFKTAYNVLPSAYGRQQSPGGEATNDTP
ncbi:MAG TPA: two-component regulator propeller domain-containing protein [Chitinophaga sp.]|uniref:hybrid sensor histidine kinase/response regulator transcription factor n=1 Tax=Chitinophaga sp. TaxID=1869181 RepID=UPI002DBCE155|nr:two-component regulator propeller domain-containing protein [Chitinophaga sp.]HEU4554555.1 two-component regulator propeller domain-containing protein [Chitinophaga sp.]